MSLESKSCSYFLLLPTEETLAQGATMESTHGQAYIGTPFRSDQMQDGATAQCSGEMGQRIRAERRGLQTVSVSEMPTPVWISVRLEATGVCIRQILTNHPRETAHVGCHAI